MKTVAENRRQKRVRAKIEGTKDKPRLSIHKTNASIYAQLINDVDAKTILGVSEKMLTTKGTKTEKSFALGKLLATKALSVKIKKVIFDRGQFRYHGLVKA